MTPGILDVGASTECSHCGLPVPAGFIDEAWVAFAADGVSKAKRSFNTTGFGRLEGTGVSRDHAVLLLKMGGLTIADWSHNGKCHIWTANNSDAPKLYRSRYADAKWNLGKNSDNEGTVHSAPKHGTWQRKVAKYIRDETGISMSQSAYMP